MDARTLMEEQWPYLLSFIAPTVDLDASAREFNALHRRRNVTSAEVLLRLAMVYGFCGLSLRETAAWAESTGVASISNVGLLKRFRAASDWLGHLLAAKLAERAELRFSGPQSMKLRLVDATTVTGPQRRGIDWRIHLSFNLQRLSIEEIQLTSVKGGERLSRFDYEEGDLVIGDRGYAQRKGLAWVRSRGAHFIVRTNWSNVPLQEPGGTPFNLLAALRSIPDAGVGDFDVQTVPTSKASAVEARLVAITKSEVAAQQERDKILRTARKKGWTPDLRTLESAGYTFVLTSLTRDQLNAQATLELYRFRWQIEMAFKHLKSLIQLGDLPARDPCLAKTVLCTKLLTALLLDDLTESYLAFSPWGFRHQLPTS